MRSSPIVLRFPGLPGRALPVGGDLVPRLAVDAEAWACEAIDLPALDDRVDALAAAGPFAIHVTGSPLDVAGEVEVRCQRWSDRRNAASKSEDFTRLLRWHRDLHDLEKPLLHADYRHALDTWQWVLRLDPEAGAAVQLAALFHDVERIFSEAETRGEQSVQDYDDYKARHAARSARVTETLLREEGVAPALRGRVADLIAGHDQPGRVDGPEGELLEDADALSYFSLNSAGYLNYYGAEQARRKADWTRARLSARGLVWLGRLHQPSFVEVGAL